MPIACLGVNHKSAPVALRERLAFHPEAQRSLYSRVNLTDLEERAGLGELAILSTCNRTEIYAAAADPAERFAHVPAVLEEILTGERNIPRADLQPHLYRLTGTAAVRHLCRVAAGLDSMVLGEFEILGQVAGAHALAAGEGAAGTLLDAAFRTAVRAGRRARAETAIARSPMSVSSEAIRLADEVTGGLAALEILLVGTGKMGRLAGESLRARGARRLSVVSRTTRHAELLAAGWDAAPLPWHHLGDAIARSDLVFCSTSAPHAVITHELVQGVIARRHREQPLVFVDVAVPRDVEEEVGRLPNVRVFDLDDIQRRLNGNLETRRREVPHVERIVEEEVVKFDEWRHAAGLRPVLAAMREVSEAIRRAELERALGRLHDVPPGLRQQLEDFSRSLVNKLLHEPTRRLRQELDPARSDAYVRLVRELFQLDAAVAKPAERDTAA